MPIYVFRCGCGARFEHLTSMTDITTPECPVCGGETRKVPSGFTLGGQASAGLSKDEMPQTWRGVYNGSAEYIDRMRRTWEQRQKLEAKYPEIADDQRPILAHEGRYHDAPLRVGDIPLRGTPPMPGEGHAGADGHGHGSGAGRVHGHGHGHGHGHSHGHGGGPAADTKPTAGSG